MLVVEGRKAGSASGNMLHETYVWANRLLWPVVSVVSGLTTYWTFALPRHELLVQAGGCVFGVFAAIGALYALVWWCSDVQSPP